MQSTSCSGEFSGFDDFDERLEELATVAEELAAELNLAAEALRESGIPPDDALTERLGSYAARFDSLRRQLDRAALEEGLPPPPEPESSAAALRRRGAEVVEARRRRIFQDRRNRAVEALGRLAEFAPVDSSAGPVVDDLRSASLAILEELSQAPADALDDLFERAAPFEALDRLARERASLPTDTATRLFKIAETSLGDAAMAVLLGRIVPPVAPSPLETRPAATADLQPPGIDDEAAETTATEDREALRDGEPPRVEAESETPPDEPPAVAELDEANEDANPEEPEAAAEPVEEVEAAAEPVEEDETAAEPVEEVEAAAEPVEEVEAAAAIGGDSADAWDELVWRLIRENRPGAAFHLNHYRALNGRAVAVSPEILEILALLPALRSSTSDAAPRIRDLMFSLRPDGSSGGASSLLAFAAAIRPALFLQGTGVSDFLRGLRFGSEFPGLTKLRDALLSPPRTDFRVTASQLKGNAESSSWHKELREFQKSVDDWLSRERTSQVIYAPTTNIWRAWLSDEGPIGRMLSRIGHDEPDEAALDATRDDARLWSDQTHVDHALRQKDYEIRRTGAQRRPIDARALTSIRSRCREAADHARAWLQLLQRRPTGGSNWIDEQVAEFREELITATRGAQSNLESLAADQSPPMAAALSMLRRELDDLADSLDPATPEKPAPSPRRLLGEDLLRAPGLDLDDRWEPPDPSAEAVGLGLFSALSTADQTWPEILAARWEQKDFAAAERVLEILEDGDGESAGTDLRSEHRDHLTARRDELTEFRERLRSAIEKARLKGLIDEDDRLNLTERLDENAPERSLRLDRDEDRLKVVENDFDAMKQRRIKAFGTRFAELGLSDAHPAWAKVRRLLEEEDLVTAHELLELLKVDRDLPEAESTVPGFDFFDPSSASGEPDMFSRLDPLFAGKNRLRWRDIARLFGERRQLAGIDLAQLLTPNEAAQGRRVMEDWDRLRTGCRDAKSAVERVLKLLGFQVRSLRELPETERAAQRFDLDAVAFESRDDCLLSDYGSKCRGRYEIVRLEGQPLEQEILRLTNPERHSTPVIAFYFGAMSARRRRDLAHALRRRGARRLLVLDEILLLYVLLRKQRPAAFLHAASQFGVAEPYVTTSSQVHPEMFFGRRREIDSVFRAEGSNLVYGGRQLGKTALLNEVRRRHHRPEAGILIELIDLKHDEHIGLNRPLDHIWTVIAERLQEQCVIAPGTRKPETLSKQIVEWLNGDAARRIVLLLDEADLFLDSDGKEGWPRVGKLKTIMEQTQRRFKVVFAGLHNVQRASHDVNTPLAHLGAAVCVGPFLDHAEMRDAADMVSLPLRALGYRFERPELVARVLAQANYYPSLIQILCQQLLKRLGDPQDTHYGPNQTPPYVIRLDDLEDAFASPEARRQIHDRFRWTIELDNRYRVIALWLAFEASDDAEATTRGFTLSEIRREARGLWPEGFAESDTNDAFHSLLEEMCELGVLRRREDGRYAMRSPNVSRLLGAREDIWRALEDACNAPAKIEYEARSFRRVYDQHSKWRRDPLTAEQESLLLSPNAHGVFALFGSPAAGHDEVVPFLQILAGPGGVGRPTVAVFDNLRDVGAFEGKLAEQLRERGDGLALLVVKSPCPWTEQWVAVAIRELARRAGAKRRVKVVFLGDPRTAWLWSDPNRGSRQRELERRGFVELNLGPWSDAAVRRWRKEAEFGEDTEEGSRLFREATGNWGALLCEVGRRCVEQPHAWKEVVASRHPTTSDAARKTLEAFGVVPEALAVLKTMAAYGDPINAEGLAELLESNDPNASSEPIERVLRWADGLAWLRAERGGDWRLDPFLAKLLMLIPDTADVSS